MQVTKEFVERDVVAEFGTPTRVDKTLHESGEGFEVRECRCSAIVIMNSVI